MEVTAPTFPALLADCTTVVRRLVAGDSPVREAERRPVAVAGSTASDVVRLLVRELLDEFSLDGFVPARLDAPAASRAGVTGEVLGERFDPARHEAQPEVKALTRHALAVEATPEGWRVELLFDV